MLLAGWTPTTGLCEGLSTTTTVTAVSERANMLVVAGEFEWCDEVDTGGSIDERRGRVAFAQLRGFDGTVTAWFLDTAAPNARRRFASRFGAEAGAPKPLSALAARVRTIGAVPLAQLRVSPRGCTSAVRRVAEKPAGDADFEEEAVTLQVRQAGRIVRSHPVGNSAVDGGDPVADALFLPATRRLLVTSRLYSCGGPPPGYGGDDGGECYPEEMNSVEVLANADLGRCFVDPTVGTTLPALEIAEICLVAGSVPYAKLDVGQSKVLKLVAAGAPAAALYDTRDLDEATWGRLLVVAGAFPTKADARPLAAALKQKGIKTQARRCSPLRDAHPVRVAADVRPVPAMSNDRVAVEAGPVEPGCLGWSPKLKGAVCVDGYGVEGQISEWQLRARGTTPLTIPLPVRDGFTPQEIRLIAQDVKQLHSAVGGDGLRSLAGLPQRELRRRQSRVFQLAPNTPHVGIRWQRGELMWRCGRGAWTRLTVVDYEDKATASVRIVPGGRLLIVLTEEYVDNESDARSHEHFVVTPARCPAQ